MRLISRTCIERFPKYLGKKLKFQETETQFCVDKRTMSTTTLTEHLPVTGKPLYLFAGERKHLKLKTHF